MKQNTLLLFAAVLLLVVVALVWFQMHQHELNTSNKLLKGGMSAEALQKFLDHGIECHETYELQGYEAAESLFRMFGLNQHEFYNLNPGQTMEFQPGTVLCVRGVWGVKPPSGTSMTWFWPAVVILAASSGFLASKALAMMQTTNKPHQLQPPQPPPAAPAVALTPV